MCASGPLPALPGIRQSKPGARGTLDPRAKREDDIVGISRRQDDIEEVSRRQDDIEGVSRREDDVVEISRREDHIVEIGKERKPPRPFR